MIAGRTTYACNGSYSPTTTNYVANEFRAFIHDVTGSGGAITMPARPFVKLFRNQTTGPITVACGGLTATIQTGRYALVYSDATDCRKFWDNDAGGARLTNLANPTQNQDAATKLYVDTEIAASGGGTAGLPPLTSNRGRYLKVTDDELATEWETGWEVKSANFAAIPGGHYLVDTSGGPVTATLWASPNDGDACWFADAAQSGTGWFANNLTIARNGSTIRGLASDLPCNVAFASFGLSAVSSNFRIVE